MTVQESEQAERFRQIAELGGDIAWMVEYPNVELSYLSPTAPALLGYRVDEIKAQLERAMLEQAGPLAGLFAGLAERITRLAAGDQTRVRLVREHELIHANGGAVTVEIISTIRIDKHGAPAALMGIVRDLGPQRAREQQQRRFISMLSHEFRTPLSTIDGAIQRLEVTGVGADDATRQRYRKIAGAVDRLIAMLDEYLSPERMAEIGRIRKEHAVSPRTLLEECAEQARALGRTITVDAGAAPERLRCDPDGLRLALQVLLDNALKYTPAASPIALVGRIAAEGGMELLVCDNGPGFDEQELPLLFDKFFRGRNAAGQPGSGLGLYMARSVVEIHGGILSASNRESGGADFRIWLPAQQSVGK